MFKRKNKRYIKLISFLLSFAIFAGTFTAAAEAVDNANSTYDWLIDGNLTTTAYSEDAFSKYQDDNFEANTAEIFTYNESGEVDYTYSLTGTVGEASATLDLNFWHNTCDLGNAPYDSAVTDGAESFVAETNGTNFMHLVYGFGIGWSLDLPQIEYINTTAAYFHTGGGKAYRIGAVAPTDENAEPTYKLCGFPYDYTIEKYYTYQSEEDTTGTFSGFVGTDRYGNKEYFNRDGRFIKSADKNGTQLKTATYDENRLIASCSENSYTINFVRTQTTDSIKVSVNMAVGEQSKNIGILTIQNDKLSSALFNTEDESSYTTNDGAVVATLSDTGRDTVSFDYSEEKFAILTDSESTALTSGIGGYNGLLLTDVTVISTDRTEYSYTAADSENAEAVQLAELYNSTYVAYSCETTANYALSYSKEYKLLGAQSSQRNSVISNIESTSIDIVNEGYDPADPDNTSETDTNPKSTTEKAKSFHEFSYNTDAKIGEDVLYTAEYDEENQAFSENTPSEKIVYDYTVTDEIESETLSAVNEIIENAVTVTDSIYEENEETLECAWSEPETLSKVGKNSNGEIVYNDSGDDIVYYSYDGNGIPIKEVVSDGLTSVYINDSYGNVILQTVTDGAISRSTRNFYDNYDRLLRKIGPEEYDEDKDSLTINSRGVCVESSYSDTLSGEHYTYDSNNNLLTHINRAGNKTVNVYDSNGRIIKTTTYATTTDAENDIGGLTTRYIYDGNGNLIQTVYPHQYNVENDNLDVSNGINEYTDNTIGERVTYDDDGNVLTYTDSFGKETVNTYDSQNHLVKSVKGDEITRFVYNGGDNLIQVIYPEQYNPADDNLDLTAETPVDTYSNSNVGDRYTYDDNGNVLTYTNTYGTVTTNTYDDEGNLVSTTKPDGTVFAFDDESRATKETYSNGLIRDFSYDSNQTAISSSNGITVTYNLNSFGEVTEYKLQNGENNKDYSYTYDSNGNITTISLNGSLQQTFTYNSSNELVRVDDAVINKTFTYDYDYIGNVTSVKTYIYTSGEPGIPLTTENYTYNSENQRTDLSYDENGNMTSLNGFSCTWDGRRLSSAVSSDANISYTYNHNGIRTSKTINGITTYYEVDENNNVVKQYELVDDVETNVIEFVYDSNNTPIYFTYNNATYYYEKNLQGDIVAILDANGNTVVEYAYNIWGELVSITGSLADTIGAINPLRYRGYYYDTETNLYYLQSRYYSPDLMRFISQDDPVLSNDQGQPLGSNLYAYCLNNPSNLSDYDGFASFKIVGVGIQIELGWGALTGGIEIIWYFSSQVNVGKRSRTTPYVYLYGGAGIGQSAKTKNVLKSMIKKPSLLFNPKSLVKGFNLSVCVFAVFGYSNFKSPNSYLKWFSETYASAWHVKGYTSWSNTCFVVGVGWSSNFASVGYSKSYYIFASDVFSGINKLYSSVLKKGKTIKG